MKELMKELSFEGIKPGVYASSPPPKTSSLLDSPIDLSVFSPGIKDNDSYSFRRAVRNKGLANGTAESPSSPRETYRSLDGSEEFGLESEMSMSYAKPADKTPGTGEVAVLERILSEEYRDNNLRITRIDKLPKSRKEVKRVYFVSDDELHQIWIFKANPTETARELNICSIVYEKGIPTAKPIGHVPEIGEKYPYDVAILGGVVEHAGDPYDSLLENLKLTPDLMYRTAKNIGRLLADFHFKLTISEEDFAKRGIVLNRASPRREIETRMLPVLRVDDECAEGLIRACEKLHYKQRGDMVVTHGDDHTGNIVTQQKASKLSLSDFGIIDYGSLCIDFADSDLADFWIHHQRKALEVNRNYSFDFEGVREDYRKRIDELGREHGISFEVGNKRNAVIQGTLWNIYEMFDPTRKNSEDAKRKFNYHYKRFLESRDELVDKGFGRDFASINRQLSKILDLSNRK